MRFLARCWGGGQPASRTQSGAVPPSSALYSGPQLTLGIDNGRLAQRYHGGTVEVSLFAPLWICNETGRDLVFEDEGGVAVAVPRAREETGSSLSLGILSQRSETRFWLGGNLEGSSTKSSRLPVKTVGGKGTARILASIEGSSGQGTHITRPGTMPLDHEQLGRQLGLGLAARKAGTWAFRAKEQLKQWRDMVRSAIKLEIRSRPARKSNPVAEGRDDREEAGPSPPTEGATPGALSSTDEGPYSDATSTFGVSAAARPLGESGASLFEFAVEVVAGPPDSPFRLSRHLVIKTHIHLSNESDIWLEAKQQVRTA